MQLKSKRSQEEQNRMFDRFEKKFPILADQYGEDEVPVKEIEIWETPEHSFVSVCFWTNFWKAVLPIVDYVIINVTNEEGEEVTSYVIEQEKLMKLLGGHYTHYDEPVEHFEMKEVKDTDIQKNVLGEAHVLELS